MTLPFALLLSAILVGALLKVRIEARKSAEIAAPKRRRRSF
jgi:hypothetical protein